MKFDYDDEQRLLADSVSRFLAHDYGFEARRKIVASEPGFSATVWQAFADLGLLGLGLPPDYGGYGGYGGFGYGGFGYGSPGFGYGGYGLPYGGQGISGGPGGGVNCEDTFLDYTQVKAIYVAEYPE